MHDVLSSMIGKWKINVLICSRSIIPLLTLPHALSTLPHVTRLILLFLHRFAPVYVSTAPLSSPHFSVVTLLILPCVHAIAILRKHLHTYSFIALAMIPYVLATSLLNSLLSLICRYYLGIYILSLL